MINKVTIELALPFASDENCESILVEQTANLVRLWKDVLNSYKEKGITVPSVSVRGITVKKEVDVELKEFKTKLLDHLLKYQPKVAIPAQIKIILDLYALGKTAEEWIEMFESMRAEFPMTTWRTVKWKLNNVKAEVEDTSVRELNSDEVEELRKRVRGYLPENG